MDTFYGDDKISTNFFRPNFEPVYLPQHFILMIPDSWVKMKLVTLPNSVVKLPTLVTLKLA